MKFACLILDWKFDRLMLFYLIANGVVGRGEILGEREHYICRVSESNITCKERKKGLESLYHSQTFFNSMVPKAGYSKNRNRNIYNIPKYQHLMSQPHLQ